MTALLASVLVALAVAGGAGLVSRISARGGLGSCLAGQIMALLIRAAGLVGIAFLVHLRWPGDLLGALSVAAVVVLVGLALDVRHLLRTVRTPSEERVRA
jgi:hypothetical protein